MVPQILAKIPLLSTQLYFWVLSWQLSLDNTWLKLNPISTPFSHSIFSSWGNYLLIVIHISNAGVLLYFISSRSIWNHSVVSHYCLPCVSLIHFFLFFSHSYHSSHYIVFFGLKFEKSCLLLNKLSLLFVPSLFCSLENIYSELLNF